MIGNNVCDPVCNSFECMYDMGDCELGNSRCQNCDGGCQEPSHVCQIRKSCPTYKPDLETKASNIMKITLGIVTPSFFFAPFLAYFFFEKRFLRYGKSEDTKEMVIDQQ